MRILAFPGARRRDSLNRKLVSLAARIVERSGATVDLAELREFDMPLYDGDDEAGSGIPAGAQELARRLSVADGFLISSPEYNFGTPGVLKNAIDWTSRIKPQPWRGKVGCLISASPSLVGGNRGLWCTRVSLEVLSAIVHPDMFSLAQAHQAFDESGKLKDAALAKRLETSVESYLSLLRSVIAAR